ncbi:arsenic transporter [Bacillus tuaregi]|uniref:arsenic transporter n=1 Tax=Bacillus tuaregi TaxID=1816695 RepID=UPI000A068420|nr:arsenic transporter [Bacillus tuaregi]
MLSFLFTMLLIFWRPKGINEAIPATLGAILIFWCGAVTLSDIVVIGEKVTGAAITILATMIMAIAMESIGFFQWGAQKLLELAKGSGHRLFWLTNLLCFFMTLFLNNDGSILITTPILLLLLKKLGLNTKQKLPYLISGALVATASSAPIGVSNIVNLISLEIIEMDLIHYTMMIFVPGTLGLLLLASLLYFLFRKALPAAIHPHTGIVPHHPAQIHHGQPMHHHPIQPQHNKQLSPIKQPRHPLAEPDHSTKQTRLMIAVLTYVFFVRIALFVAAFLDISISLVAVISSLLLLLWRWLYLKVSPIDLLKKTPWHIFIFAFTMYVIVYGLHNIGLTSLLINYLEPLAASSLFHASMIMGSVLTVLSNIFNNHPALMIGTLSLTQMGLDPITLKTIYLANIIGSDIGALLLPTGTLATLIWMHILRQHHVKVTWKEYLKVTLLVIPITVVFTLILLYIWIEWIIY